MTENTEDSELVAAIVGGDPRSWGDVFDRYRDRVWQVAYSITRRQTDAEDVVQSTFLKAVESISQLRDPTKLRPWLLAIARRLALDSVSRGREVAHDEIEEAVGSTTDPDEMISGLHREEMIQLVVAAFDGLEPKDRAALELSERQGLGGDELAESLGVTRDNAYAMIHNAKDRFASSVTSLMVARHGRAECSDLDTLLEGWDGDLTPLLRKRVARHVRTCPTCGETKRLRVSPAVLAGLLPVVAMSTLAVDQSRAAAMEAAGAGTGSTAVSVGGFAASKVAAMVAAAALVAASGVGLWSMADGDDDSAAENLIAATTTVPSATSTITPSSTSVTASTTSLAGVSFCEAADLLHETSSPGPVSAQENDIRTYVTTVNDLIQQLVTVSGPNPDRDLIAYASAYQGLVDAEIWNPAEFPDSDELARLTDSVQSQLDSTCGTSG